MPHGNGPLVGTECEPLDDVELDEGDHDGCGLDVAGADELVPFERADDGLGALGLGIWISAIMSPFRTSSTTIIPVDVPRYTCQSHRNTFKGRREI